MATKTINELIADTVIAGTEEIPVWDISGATLKATVDQIKAYILANVDTLSFNIAFVSGDLPEGSLTWNADDHTLNLHTGLGGVVGQVNQELLLLIWNPANAAENILDGWPISLDGSSGLRPIGYRTDVTSEASCRCYMGLSTMAIPKGTHGFVNRGGLVRGISTSAFEEGDRLWVQTNSPYLTNVEPTLGQRILVGIVLTKSANGLVYSNPNHYELTAEGKRAVDSLEYAIKENHVPSGFPTNVGSTLSMVENVGAVNDTFSVTITGTNFPVYIDGERYLKNTETVTQVGATSRRYFIYYDADTQLLTVSSAEWILEPDGGYDGKAFVATVLWDAVNHRGILEEERHHSWRDIHWHHWAHHSVGARYVSAHNANGLNLSNPAANQYATFSVTEGDIYDEDILNNIGIHTTANLFYHHSDGTMVFERAVTAPYKLVAGIPQYDNGTGLADKIASNTTGYFVSWMYGTNAVSANGNSQLAIVVGQDANNTMTLAEAQSVAQPTLPVDFVVEWRLLWKIIYRFGAGNTLTWISNTDYRTASSLPYGQVPTSNISASSVTTSPFDDIASTNQQAVNEELGIKRVKVAQGYINGQKDTRTDIVASTDGATYDVDCSLGNAFKVTPTDTSGFDYILNFINIPTGAFEFSVAIYTVVGTNAPTVAYKVAGSAVTPIGTPAFVTGKVNRFIFDTIDNGPTLYVNGSTF